LILVAHTSTGNTQQLLNAHQV